MAFRSIFGSYCRIRTVGGQREAAVRHTLLSCLAPACNNYDKIRWRRHQIRQNTEENPQCLVAKMERLS